MVRGLDGFKKDYHKMQGTAGLNPQTTDAYGVPLQIMHFDPISVILESIFPNAILHNLKQGQVSSVSHYTDLH